MKILLFLLPIMAFPQHIPICNSLCNIAPQINSSFFTPPDGESNEGLITLSGNSFPNCARNTKVTFAGKYLEIISANEKEIKAKISSEDYKEGSYRVIVTKTQCPERSCSMDATIVPSSGLGNEFTRRQTTPFSIFPNSYAEVEVACDADETAISGGYIFSTWEIKLVSSYPDGRYWRFKIYNNENITSMLNEFYAICVR